MPTPQSDLNRQDHDIARRLENNSRPTRPGWLEIGAAAVGFGALFLLTHVILQAIPDEDAVASGLAAYTMSAVIGLGAFAAAWSVRIRNLTSFGVRKVRWTWLLLGAGLGLTAFIGGNFLVLAYKRLSGYAINVQDGYQAAAAGGPVLLIASLLLGAVATPIGEELAFRGVLTNALGRYGPWVAVPGSAIIFAVCHGFNPVLVVALIVGVFTALLFHKTGSIWPGVCVHLVNNLLITAVPVLNNALR